MMLYPADKFNPFHILRRLANDKVLTPYKYKGRYFVLVDNKFKELMGYMGKPVKGYLQLDKAKKVKYIPKWKEKDQ